MQTYSYNNSIKFVLSELSELEKGINSRHFWTIVVSNSKILIYRADSGYEVLLLGLGIFISHFIRKFTTPKLLGTDITNLLEKKKKKYIFNREKELKIKLVIKQQGDFGSDSLLILGDSTEIILSLKNLKQLKQAIHELEYEHKL